MNNQSFGKSHGVELNGSLKVWNQGYNDADHTPINARANVDSSRVRSEDQLGPGWPVRHSEGQHLSSDNPCTEDTLLKIRSTLYGYLRSFASQR